VHAPKSATQNENKQAHITNYLKFLVATGAHKLVDHELGQKHVLLAAPQRGGNELAQTHGDKCAHAGHAKVMRKERRRKREEKGGRRRGKRKEEGRRRNKEEE
jgi:hypothetical protein